MEGNRNAQYVPKKQKTVDLNYLSIETKEIKERNILKELQLEQPTHLFMSFGGASGLKALSTSALQRLQKIFYEVAKFAGTSKSIIIDGGTKSGVMELMGKVISELGNKTPLLGVVPEKKITYPGHSKYGTRGLTKVDINHSHFLFISDAKDWGKETEGMFLAADIILNSKEGVKGPYCIVSNGGKNTLTEVLHAMKRNWKLIVIAGSVYLADELAYLKKLKVENKDEDIKLKIDLKQIKTISENHKLTEILEGIDLISIFPATEAPSGIVAMLQ